MRLKKLSRKIQLKRNKLMRIPDYTLQALEHLSKTFQSDIARSVYIAFVWIGLGIVIGLNI